MAASLAPHRRCVTRRPADSAHRKVPRGRCKGNPDQASMEHRTIPHPVRGYLQRSRIDGWFLFQVDLVPRMPLPRRIAGVIVSLLLLQTSMTAAVGVSCASVSGQVGSVGSTMQHGSTTMQDAPKSSPVLAASVTPSAPSDQSCADSHGAACITMRSCASTESLPSTGSMESPQSHAAGVSLEPAAMTQNASSAPEVPPPRA